MQIVRFFTAIIFLASSLIGCNAQKSNELPEHKIEVFKSESSNSTFVVVETYHFEEPRTSIPVSIIVNNIILTNDIVEKKIIPVYPGRFTVKTIFSGKLENEIVLKAKKGDSILVKAYLRDDVESLHPHSDIIIPKKY